VLKQEINFFNVKDYKLNKRPPKNGERIKIINTLLVDGNALFKVGFFGAKNEYNHRGEHIGGLYQFITVVRKLLNENLYHRVYVFWDGPFSGKLRYNIYPPYKSGRGKDYINGTTTIDESEFKQKIKVQSYLEEFFIRQLQHEFVESDDFIGYYCLNKKENERITICTNDRDMCQLISEDVRIYFCDLKNYVDITNYSLYFCHHYENAALIKTIIGDYSDTIKGIKGVKQDTLLTLFPELKEKKVSLSELIEKAKEIQQERIESKKKPLKTLSNIINCITDGVQGEKIYEINYALVDLKNPMITEEATQQLNDLIEGELNPTNRGIKNVITKIKIDGLENNIGSNRYSEYLLPFKLLIEREIKNNN
jgi:5'-3' exonuclease